MTEYIFHACDADAWDAALQAGSYPGSADDKRDGFIHFSNEVQVKVSVAKHQAGKTNLVLITVDPSVLGDALKWEPSRDDALFPHLYSDLKPDQVARVDALPLGPDGVHQFPDHIIGT